MVEWKEAHYAVTIERRTVARDKQKAVQSAESTVSKIADKATSSIGNEHGASSDVRGPRALSLKLSVYI